MVYAYDDCTHETFGKGLYGFWGIQVQASYEILPKPLSTKHKTPSEIFQCLKNTIRIKKMRLIGIG